MRDHDLLIEIKTKLEGLTEDVRHSARTTDGKADRADVVDHERRIRDLESKVWRAVGAIAFIQFLATLLSVAAFLRTLG